MRTNHLDDLDERQVVQTDDLDCQEDKIDVYADCVVSAFS